MAKNIREAMQNSGKKKQKKYYVEDLQKTDFMGDTYKKPMTMNQLRRRFWNTEDARTTKYKDFNKDFIEDTWEVRLKEHNGTKD